MFRVNSPAVVLFPSVADCNRRFMPSQPKQRRWSPREIPRASNDTSHCWRWPRKFELNIDAWRRRAQNDNPDLVEFAFLSPGQPALTITATDSVSVRT